MAKQTLNKRGLLALVASRHEDVHRDISKTSVEIIIETIADALAQGRPVALRGFGRLIPRRYDRSSNKRFGLLFHPSPRLVDLVNDANDKRTKSPEPPKGPRTGRRALSARLFGPAPFPRLSSLPVRPPFRQGRCPVWAPTPTARGLE